MMNLIKRIKAVAKKSWGAHFDTIRCFYLAFIRSKITYGGEIWGDFPQSKMQDLEKLQNEALRRVLGCPKSTSVAAMRQIQSNIPPLKIYLQQMLLKKRAELQQLDEAYKVSRLSTIESSNTFNNKARRSGKKTNLTSNIKMAPKMPQTLNRRNFNVKCSSQTSSQHKNVFAKCMSII
ncbi:Uncharacterised protein r2_g2816 [Pycnogonum litorale]